MMKKKYIYIYILTILFITGCSANKNIPAENPTKSTTYTSAFPTKDVSKNLEKIQRSVVRISSTAQYTTYFFEDEPVIKSQLKELNIREIATRRLSETKSSAGTAITISANYNWGMLLTNHHVIDYPDTLFRYAKSNNIEPETQVEAIAIKTDQRDFIFDSSYITPFEVINVNQKTDLALLEVNRSRSRIDLDPLRIKTGNSKKLKLGSVLYIMGYPQGVSMVTRSIVSDPNRDKNSGFLTDALFNKGISGGIILASRNSYNSFEWVGVASSSFAKAEYYLVPDPSKSYNYNQFDIYEDDLFVELKRQISYGVTEAIPMPTVLKFLENSKPLFNRRNLKPILSK